MRQTFNWQQKIIQLTAVLIPIFVTQLAITSTGFFNTVMAGHISEADLAGVAVGVNLFFPFFVMCQGIVSGLTPTIAQLYGAQQPKEISHVIRQAFYWAFALGVIIIILGYALAPKIIGLLNLDPEVAYIMGHYLMAISFGVIQVFMAQVLRNLIDAHGMTRLTMIITLVTVPVNIGLNFIFMYGYFGMPKLGGIGAGVGSAVTWTLSLLLNSIVVANIKSFKQYGVFKMEKPDISAWKKQLLVGVPIGGTMFCEASIYGAVGMLMTVYGTSVMAAHQAALNFSSVVYMIPMSISMALTIIIGYEIGAGRQKDAKSYRRIGWFMSALFSGSLAFVLIHYREMIASLYTANETVHEYLMIFLVYAIILQVADGINAPLQGTLRGYKDVHVTFLLAVLSFWLIGLPSGWVMANYFFGPYGYWMGLISGILLGAALLTVRLYLVEKRYWQKRSADV